MIGMDVSVTGLAMRTDRRVEIEIREVGDAEFFSERAGKLGSFEFVEQLGETRTVFESGQIGRASCRERV